MYVSVGWNIFFLRILGIWGLFVLQSRIVMISWKNSLRIRKPAKYLFVWWIVWMYLSRHVNGYCSGSVSSLRVSGCKRSETQAKSLVSFQSFCAIVSPHRMRTAFCLPANYCFCRIKGSYNSATWIHGKSLCRWQRLHLSSVVHCHEIQDFNPKEIVLTHGWFSNEMCRHHSHQIYLRRGPQTHEAMLFKPS